jgi:hypothetical protein
MADIIANNVQPGAPDVENPNAELAGLGIEPNEPGMAVPVALRMYRMFLELGILPDAAKALIKDQAINSLTSLTEMSEEEITVCCKVIRRPGGSIEQPLAGIGRNANRTQRVAAYGAPMAIIHETNLKLARFYLKYKEMTSRTVEPEDVTVQAIKKLRNYKVILEKGSTELDVDRIPNLTHEKTFEWFDEFREFLNTRISATSGRPLAYVVRKREAVKAPTIDPPKGEQGSAYKTYADEIRERAPVRLIDNTLDLDFEDDNALVWQILWSKLKGGKYQSYIKPYLDQQDARGAFIALHTQLLGRAAIANYANAAENKLTNLALDGTKTKGWTFDKYLVQHKEQHMILDKLKNYDHAGISESSKINHFVRGITDPAYVSVLAALATSPKDDFDEVVASFRTFRNSSKGKLSGHKRSINIAAVSTSTGNRTNDRAKKTGEKEDGFDIDKDYTQYSIAPRFYKVQEWNRLSKGQRNFLRKNSRLKNSNNKKSMPSQIKALQVRLAELQSQTLQRNIARLESAAITESDDTDDSDEPPFKRKKGTTFLVSKKR